MRLFPKDRSGSKKGSALLIVLGFLSFMIVSGVSFAIYMRIERQASSNYRHATTARHLLNAALYRAMDEIDSELRLKYVAASSTGLGGSTPAPMKFPTNWLGRVKTSAVANSAHNGQDAHVLSMESLSFLPSFLVNDVRRYAVRQDGDAAFRGAKWRTLSRSPDDLVVGRYAYACVNISDMLDVNVCKAAIRDSATNRVSVGHLFGSDSARETFDTDSARDIRYFSMQDFYAVRYDRDPTVTGSPYHDYLKKGQLTVFENSANLDHVFCTDSIVKPEPKASGACNIALNPPISSTLLNNARPNAFSALQFGSAVFWEALQKVTTPNIAASYQTLMAAMIADYLDKDDVPKQLAMPSVEMVPMINKIIICKDLLKAKVFKGDDSADDPPQKQYGIELVENDILSGITGGGQIPLMEVQVAFPFKYFKDRPNFKTQNYSLKARMSFNIVSVSKAPLTTHNPDLNGGTFRVELESDTVSVSLSGIPTTGGSDDNEYYRRVGIPFKMLTPPAQNQTLLVKVKESDGSMTPLVSGLGLGEEVCVACTVLVQVLNSDGYAVDQVPCMLYMSANPPKGWDDVMVANWKGQTPKLYYPTETIVINTLPANENKRMEYADYNSLEIPDPRFNHSAINWVADNVAWSAPVGRGQKNTSTAALLGKDGRDADIFMSVSDAGYMQSPGELGFIVRPYPGLVKLFGGPSGYPAVNFSNQRSVTDMAANSNPDLDGMFRTLRLYDNDETYTKDNIYTHFYVGNSDGTVTGARVNPLSDMPEVLEAAIWATPLDYWYASSNATKTVKKEQTFNKSPFHFNNNKASWDDFRDVWADAVFNVNDAVNSAWKNSISDYYGNFNRSKWHSANDVTKIFNDFTLNQPMHEIDRKMLFSFSLDSFSDRQQLFLLFIRAESTVPSFGSGADGGMRSLAGGKAVALVWRDPYPRGYVKSPESWEKRSGSEGWYPRLNSYTSPWIQYGSTSMDRWDGWHDMRVLFFKQLDQ